jgi:hypothetical protein
MDIDYVGNILKEFEYRLNDENVSPRHRTGLAMEYLRSALEEFYTLIYARAVTNTTAAQSGAT